MKRKIIEKLERGVSVADLARTHNLSTSTVCTTLKNKDKIKETDASKGVTRISTQWLRILDDAESTPLLQPMDQQVISNFKKLYTKALSEPCLEVAEGTNLTLTEFWKYHFHIVACLKMIEKAWKRVTKRTLTSAWKKLWPESVVKCDFEGFEIVPVELVVNEIIFGRDHGAGGG
ncbi:hypothetical protein B7P43_G16984 [Cryptotermes secundus]|uniref:HTH psq-type domain-containing protein n=1 Tax=Cryptotermes secundus TaxID=105785 RepID=A0A2J7PV30_9NEOP|nr:hypothetical protein B7P43_G16984 [Cryptotermes secundus]